MEKTFKTKTGTCEVTADQIVLADEGVKGKMAAAFVKNKTVIMLILYCLTSAVIIYVAYDSYVRGDMFTTTLFGLLAVQLIRSVIKSLSSSATPIIKRNDITSIRFIKGIGGLSRSRFEIAFKDGSKVRTRVIELPGALQGGQSETDKALKIMKDEKLLK